jgi:Tfp pilus assembly protein PilV
MKSLRVSRSCSASLIEVMLVVALTAVTALGLIASQLWIAREARAAALREHAVFVADAVAEAARVPTGGDAALRNGVPARRVCCHMAMRRPASMATGCRSRVTWLAVATLRTPGEVIDKPESCGDLAIATGLACVALAFVK